LGASFVPTAWILHQQTSEKFQCATRRCGDGFSSARLAFR
jgi:hypothetical protein